MFEIQKKKLFSYLHLVDIVSLYGKRKVRRLVY